MKYIKYLLPLVTAVVAFLFFSMPINAAQDFGKVFITPQQIGVQTGAIFSVEIRANIGQFARRSATRINLEYDNTKLKALGTTVEGSAFGGVISILHNNSGKPGVGMINHYAFVVNPPRGNNRLVYKATFKALQPGNTTLSIADNVILNGTNYISRGNSNVLVYNPTCPPGQVGTPPNCTTPPKPDNPPPDPPGQEDPKPDPPKQEDPKPDPPKTTPPPKPTTPRPTPKPTTPRRGGSTPRNNNSGRRPSSSNSNRPSTPSGNPTQPEPGSGTPSAPIEEPSDQSNDDDSTSNASDSSRIRNIQVKAGYDTVTITWISEKAKASGISFGESQTAPKKAVSVTKTGANSFSATIASLKPGSSYHYTITTTSDEESTGETYRNGTFSTRGYPVKITTRTSRAAVSGVSLSVKNHASTVTTKDDGTAELELPSGTHSVTALHGSKSLSSDIQVRAVAFSAGTKPPVQEFTITLESSAEGNSGFILIITGILVLLMAIAMVIVFLVIRKRRAAANTYTYQSFFDDSDAWSAPPTEYSQQQPISDSQYQMPFEQQNGDFNYYQPPQEDLPENELFADLTPTPPPPPPAAPTDGNDPTQYPN